MSIWMLWSVLFATLVALAAVATERIAAHWALPRRMIWLAALVLCAVVPTLLATRPARQPLAELAPVAEATAGGVNHVESPTAALPITQSVERAAVANAGVDIWLVRLWLLLSVAVFSAFAHSAIALRRQRVAWRETELTLCRALVSKDVGPAVVGFFPPRVVVPQWTLTADAPTRDMILHHEIEHLRARDPHALLASGVVLVVFPWNLPLWWIVKRLRIAIELDCDARVVRRIGKPYEYGRMLLAVGEGHANSLPLAASLTGRRPLLERRIHAMMMQKPRRPLLASLPFAVFAFAAVTAATRAPHPAPFNAISSAQTQRPYPTREEIAAMLQASVPALGSSTDSSNYALVVLDANNNFVTATAGYGSLMIQVWGDTLMSALRAVRTYERTGVPVEPVRAAGSGPRGRSGGGFGSSSASAGSSDGRGSIAVSTGGIGGGGSGSVAVSGSGIGGGMGIGSGSGAVSSSIIVSGSGSGAVSASTSGANEPTSGTEPAGPGIRRFEWQGSIELSSANGAILPPLERQPRNAYSAGMGMTVGPGPASGLHSFNNAPGLHALSAASEDDSAIDGIPASSLTSLETYRFLPGPLTRKGIKVFVVTTNSVGR